MNLRADLNVKDADLLAQLKAHVQRSVQMGCEKIAAFDADGTLWHNDMGESFFQYMIDNKLVDLPEKPWAHYHKLKETSPDVGYLWLAQICKGHTLEQVRLWARQHVELYPPEIIELQKQLIAHLYELRFQIFVVTASVKWAVEPAALLLNVPMENVLGVQTKIVANRITDIQEGPMTWRSGKRDALLAATSKKSPGLAFGNTLGDLDLINTASHLRVALALAPKDSHMYAPERDLLANAKGPNWVRIVA